MFQFIYRAFDISCRRRFASHPLASPSSHADTERFCFDVFFFSVSSLFFFFFVPFIILGPCLLGTSPSYFCATQTRDHTAQVPSPPSLFLRFVPIALHSYRERRSFSLQRRSTIKVHPNFSEAPQLRSSVPPPENRLRQKSNGIPMNDPTAQVFKNVIFETRLAFSDDFGLRSPVIQKKIAEVCHLYLASLVGSPGINRVYNIQNPPSRRRGISSSMARSGKKKFRRAARAYESSSYQNPM